MMTDKEVLLLRRKLDLLLRTGKLLMESAADTNRIERNMKRVAAFMGIPEEKLHIDIRWTMIMVHRISICSFSSGIPIKAATRFMFRSIRFVSAALSINNFPVRSKRSNLRRNNNTSLSVIISFNSYVVLYILVHEDMNLK